MLAPGDQGELWQKDEGQLVGGGDGLMVEGQDRSGLESYLTWASPTWQAHSGSTINLIGDSCKTENVGPSKLSIGPQPSGWTESTKWKNIQ